MADESATPESVLAEILAFRDRAEAAALAAEDSGKKAISESTYAQNARGNADENAKSVAQVRGAVDADLAWLTTTKQNADAMANDLVKAKAAAESDGRVIAESRAASERDSAAASASKDGSAKALTSIQEAAAKIGATLNDASLAAGAVAQAKAAVDENAAAAASLREKATESATKAKDDATAAAAAEAACKASVDSIAEISEQTKGAFEKVVKYEQDLDRQAAEIRTLHAKIEGLLPNATSSGLASAFRIQKQRFVFPQIVWMVTFVVAIIIFFIVGFLGYPSMFSLGPQSPASPESWDSILRHFAARLPIVIPVVWLAIYAGRHYTIAARLQEEYAFKEAISTAFEGYKREMAGIATDDTSVPSPLVSLCENVLLTLSQRPGRIYEGVHDDVTPWSSATKTAADTADRLKNIIAPKSDKPA